MIDVFSLNTSYLVDKMKFHFTFCRTAPNYCKQPIVTNDIQGLTKAWLERDQMALGVFPNCHEYQEIDFQVF